MANAVDACESTCTIALVGKYTGLQDSYLSVFKSLKHSSIEANRKLEIVWIEAQDLCPDVGDDADGVSPELIAKREVAWKALADCDGVVVPGGFGVRGVEGMIACATWCRENRKPYLGICLGMQVMTIEVARSKLGWKAAHSEEFQKDTPHPTVVFMPEIDKATMGGTMRLGARDTLLCAGPSLARSLYSGADAVSERHRHRYEVNPALVADLEGAGLRFVGKDETETRMEIIEVARDQHPFYFGVQFHPEFKSRPQKPSPPFFGLLLAASGQLDAFLATH